MLRSLLLLLCLLPLSACSSAVHSEQVLAFPQALGYGKYTVGGRGGRIIVVDSLADSEKAEPGTLRYAVKAKGPRIVVFNVSGVIHLVKPLEIKHDFITIAGQTSPGGIVISGSETQIDANQVIIRYLRFRPGAEHDQGDAVTAKGRQHIIIDHCSLSWANDEVASFYNNRDFTLQYSIISESLNKAGHKKGSHGYGGIWGGQRASFVFNVLAHHTSRNPRINGYRLKPNYPAPELVDIRNNVIYNWAKNSAYGNEYGRFNLVNNLFKPGPATGPQRFFQINEPDGEVASLGQGHVSGNQMVGNTAMSANNMLGLEFKNHKHYDSTHLAQLIDQLFSVDAFTAPELNLGEPEFSARQSYQQLIISREVGANRNRQGHFADSVDKRILSEVAQGSATAGKGIIDSELQVINNWADYAAEFRPASSPLALPDPATIEAWLNELGDFPLPAETY